MQPMSKGSGRGFEITMTRHHYQTVEGKLRLLGTIVRSGSIGRDETWKLQSLGIMFGDALAQQMGLSWVAVEDEHGRDPPLRDQDTTLVVFPMTTISKRISAVRPSTSENCLIRRSGASFD
jgi:Domain of unknown function (DUF3806)